MLGVYKIPHIPCLDHALTFQKTCKSFKFSNRAQHKFSFSSSQRHFWPIKSRHFHTSRQLLQTHYEILGVAKTSNLKEIVKAYRKKAKEFHPDLNKEPNAEAKFVAVKAAYECLKDPQRRQTYDASLNVSSKGWNNHTGNPYRSANIPPDWNFGPEYRRWESEVFTQAHKRQWDEERRRMEEILRRSEREEAIRKMLAPYFNILLVSSLVGVAAVSLFIQWQSRSKTSARQGFPVGEDPIPTYFGQADQSHPNGFAYSQNPQTYSYYDKYYTGGDSELQKKYRTRWDDISEAMERRNDFYRRLMTTNDQETPPVQKHPDPIDLSR